MRPRNNFQARSPFFSSDFIVFSFIFFHRLLFFRVMYGICPRLVVVAAACVYAQPTVAFSQEYEDCLAAGGTEVCIETSLV